jgi:hypothetical protein
MLPIGMASSALSGPVDDGPDERTLPDRPPACGEGPPGHRAVVQSVAIMRATSVGSGSAHKADWWSRWLYVRAARLRGQTRRRVFASSVEIVQAPEADVIRRATTAEPLDHALRVDLLVGLLAGLDHRQRFGLALVRQGPAELFESDRAWIPAVLVAVDIVGAAVSRVGVVTRWGGLDTTPT